MKQFKKRTLALVLASTITVVGAFGAENYKNSLMSLRFETNQGNGVRLTMLTKYQYHTGINLTQKDADTYVVVLPDTNDEITESYDLGENIESVNVTTTPYTNSSSGYTTIVVKTINQTPLYATTALYLPENQPIPRLEIADERTEQQRHQVEPQTIQRPVDRSVTRIVSEIPSDSIRSRSGVDQTAPVDIKESIKQFQPAETEAENTKPVVNPNARDLSEMNKEDELTPAKEKWYTVLGVLFAFLIMAFFWVKAKGQMEGLVGEDKYDISEEPKKKKVPEKKKAAEKNTTINLTIKNLDKKYSKPVKMPIADTPPVKEEEVEIPEADNNIVDLDELLQQQKQEEKAYEAEINDDAVGEEEENAALEDFLSSFSFEDEDEKREQAYQECINNDKIRFSKVDIDNISRLMNSEISDEVRKHASKYMDSSEQNKKPTRKELLENFVMTYVTKQNLTFTKDDLDVLHKLVNVEIDNDFLTDLRTNPELAKEMQEEIAKQKTKPHKTSELLTLNVKDMLPDLSEALKKQGGKKIESEAKPEVVYYSEGYDVSTLKLDFDLPDLSKEINNENAYQTRPSDEFQVVDNSYEVQTMSISGLPDLKDVMENPEKYETSEPEPEEADEEKLLNNITNVSFKPFDDGTRDFEVINDIKEENAPSRSDMQEEFNQLDNGFEIVEEEEVPEAEESSNDDFISLYDNKYVDLDKASASDAVLAKNKNVASVQDETDELLKKINYIEQRRKLKKERENVPAKPKVEKKTESLPEFCVFEGKKYSIVGGSYFTDNMGCYLAKNEQGYTIIGFTGEKTFKIKHYEKLKAEKLQSRMSERMDDGTLRYIVRIGIHKFILNVKSNDMEFVMDLC